MVTVAVIVMIIITTTNMSVTTAQKELYHIRVLILPESESQPVNDAMSHTHTEQPSHRDGSALRSERL